MYQKKYMHKWKAKHKWADIFIETEFSFPYDFRNKWQVQTKNKISHN